MGECEHKKAEKLLDAGTGLVSASVGAAIGLAVGPLGAVAGALTGTMVEHAFVFVGNEIKERILSKRENSRIQTTFQIAAEKINRNIEEGKKIRGDNFFKNVNDDTSDGEKLLEGVLLVAQREFEEKKLKCLGNLYANLAFTESVTPQNANMLIKLAESTTYRQLCEIRSIATFQLHPEIIKNSLKPTPYDQIVGINNISIASEIFDLYHKAILSSEKALLDAASINPSELKIIGNGKLMLDMMELLTVIPTEDCSDVIDFLVCKGIPDSGEAIVPTQNTAAAVFG